MPRRVFQVVECLDEGDGASAVARALAALAADDGLERPILAAYAHPALRAETLPLDAVALRPDDAVILHVWGPSRLADFFARVPGRKALYFHNITPPAFFPPGTLAFRETETAWRQLRRLAALADVWLAESAFNLAALAAHAGGERPPFVIPPPIDPARERALPADAALVERLRAGGETTVLFVGRLAPNKCQHRLMAVFERYHARVNPRSRLHLVGSGAGTPLYARALERLRSRLAARDAIELPGKVSGAALAAYYRAADLFLCLSEHEGFCLPPLEAAARGIPVIAKATSALPETLGDAAILVRGDDPARLAELMQLVVEDTALRAQLHAGAEAQLARYAPAAVHAALRPALAALRG
jgi:glycosyltransferase involved in cell wall biosynthesis